jgi:RNA polymerase sigma-70 factor (ECF subfamily)
MNDDEIVTGLRFNNTKAIEKIIDLYGDRLLRSAFLLCNNETEAKDLVQETLVQAIKSASSFQEKSAIYTWLHGILLNLTRHYIRKQQKLMYVDNVPEPSPSLEKNEKVTSQDMTTAANSLLAALKQLSEPHREVIVLRYYEGMSIETIANQTGTSKGTVKSRLFYSIQELRKLIPEDLNLFSMNGTYK